MTVDLATLGVVVDASQVTPAATKLDGLTASGEAAAAATDQLTFSAGAMSAALKAANGNLATATQMLVAQATVEKGLTSSFVENGAAQTAAAAATVTAQEAVATATAESAAVQVAANEAVTGSSIKVRESLVLLREASRGNWTRFAGSVSILAGAFGLLQTVIVPLVVVAATLGAVFLVAENQINQSSGDLTRGLGLTADQLAKVKDRYVTFMDTFKATFQVLGTDMSSALGAAGGVWQSTLNALAYTGQTVLMFLAGAFKGTFDAIGAVWKLLPAAIGDALISTANATISAVQWMINEVIQGINYVSDKANSASEAVGGSKLFGAIGSVDLGQIKNTFAGAGNAAAASFTQALVNGFKSGSNSVPKFFSDVADQARKDAIANIMKEAGKPKGGGEVDGAQKQLTETENQLAAQTKLNAAVAGGTLTMAQANEQTKIDGELKNVVAERDNASGAVKARLTAIINQLIPALTALNAAQREYQLLQDNDKQQQANELLVAEIKLAGQSNDARGVAIAQLKEVQRLKSLGIDPNSAQGQRGIALAGDNASLSSLSTGLNSLMGNAQSPQEKQIAQYKEFYSTLDKLRKADLLSETATAKAKAAVDTAITQARLEEASTFFGNLTSLSQSKNRELAAIGKASAIVQATIDGVLAVQKTLGAYPAPINFIEAAAVGVSAAVNVAKISGIGFQSGGYTGDGATDEIAGVTHGQEFVIKAGAAARNRPLLEAINNGGNVGNVSNVGGGLKPANLNIQIHNHGSSKQFEIQQLGPNDIRVIARDEIHKSVPGLVSKELENPNSKASKTLASKTNIRRQQSA